MAINVRVEKSANENSASLIRRFTKRVQGSGILPRIRKIRYYKRPPSAFVTKSRKINSIKKKNVRDELVKLGKLSDQPQRRGRR